MTGKDLDIQNTLSRLGVKYEVIGNELRFPCPFHRSKGGFSQTLYVKWKGEKKGLWHCFSSGCEKKGNLVTFISNYMGVSINEALDWLGISRKRVIRPVSEDMGRLIEARTKFLEKPMNKARIDREPIELPEGCSQKDSRLEEYLVSRGFQNPGALIQNSGLTFCKWGYYEKRVVIPVWNQKQILTSFCARAIYPDQIPKILYPKGFHSKSLLLGEHQWATLRGWGLDLVLVEGPFDYLKLISLKIPAVCTFGSTLGEVQVGKIANSGFERVLIAYDGDEAGRKGALGAHRSLHPYKPTQIVNFPVGRDPGDLVSAGQFNELLEGGKSVDLVG